MITGQLGVTQLIKTFTAKIVTTWALVIVENALLALIPLFIGFAIDGLMEGSTRPLWVLMGILVTLTLFSVIRRIYDTRAYGSIKVILGCEFDRRNSHLAVSKRNSRLDLTRELVDFLEIEVPELFTAIIQLIVSLAILTSISWGLGGTALALMAVMVLSYACFHRRFYKINGALNTQMEKQVDVLSKGKGRGIVTHLKRLRQHEVKLSDTEAIVYGLIFLFISFFIIINLSQAVSLPEVTAGGLFTVINYSWEFAESAIMLPHCFAVVVQTDGNYCTY